MRSNTIADFIQRSSAEFIQSVRAMTPGLGVVACCCLWGIDTYRDVKKSLLSTKCAELLLLMKEANKGIGKMTEEVLFCLNILMSDDAMSYQQEGLQALLRHFSDDLLAATQDALLSHQLRIPRNNEESPSDSAGTVMSERESDKQDARIAHLRTIRWMAKRLKSLLEGLSDKSD